MRYRAISMTMAGLTAVATGCAPAEPVTPDSAISEIAGRTAGPARRCIPTIRTEALRLAEGQWRILVYRYGRTIWINRLRSDCGPFYRGDTLVVESVSSQYCRGDRVRTVDPVSKLRGSACILGDFVPYTR